ncbi:DUF3224 domain-containing protein [Pseudonocardia sp. TRM90224]|uniref:DUF3224 domain-containing protein n=1 Tax=Pseudonocardia sp. TRM90224 TaxID=2812678 RepID=UPI001E3BABA5|nr:DUF3224 domain-containing protein [Pseudonocardia sp. TRM90224]
MTTATGRFDLTSWDDETYDEAEGATLQRVRNTKSFEGGINGTSVADLLLAVAPQDSAAYVGIERVTAEIDGRKGTFVLRHSAYHDGTEGTMQVDVVPNSGTGDLHGLTGTLDIVRSDEGEHTYTFTYDLP